MDKNRATILGSQEMLTGKIGGAIYRTLTDLGVDSLHADSLIGSEWKGSVEKSIFTSDVVIADLSKQSANLMYEIGYARGLRKPTILIMSKNTISPIPSDLTGNFYLFYDPDDLSKFQSSLRNLVAPYLS